METLYSFVIANSGILLSIILPLLGGVLILDWNIQQKDKEEKDKLFEESVSKLTSSLSPEDFKSLYPFNALKKAMEKEISLWKDTQPIEFEKYCKTEFFTYSILEPTFEFLNKRIKSTARFWESSLIEENNSFGITSTYSRKEANSFDSILVEFEIDFKDSLSSPKYIFNSINPYQERDEM